MEQVMDDPKWWEKIPGGNNYDQKLKVLCINIEEMH